MRDSETASIDNQKIGIIDIGCNAVRFVVYQNLTLGAPQIVRYNFKSDIQGFLDKSDFTECNSQIYSYFSYISHVLKKLRVKRVITVATSVLRKHEKAECFTKYIKDNFNIEIEIISGEKEAYMMALGLLYAVPKLDGLAVDLGGGSLEFAEVIDKLISNTASLELGTKAIEKKKIKTKEALIDEISSSYTKKKYNTLYFLGGAFCFVCKVIIEFINHPIKHVHNFEMSAIELKKLINNQYVRNSISCRALNPGLHNAFLVINSIIEIFEPEKVVYSVFGLKDGIRYDLLGSEEKSKNVIWERLVNDCNYNVHDTNFDAYLDIIDEILQIPSDELRELTKLSIVLLSMAKKFEPKHCASAIVEYVLSSSVPFTMKTRVMLAIVVSVVFDNDVSSRVLFCSKRIIKKSDYDLSKMIGYFLQIVRRVDGDEFIYPSFKIVVDQYHYFEIRSDFIMPNVVFKHVHYLLRSIAFIRKRVYAAARVKNLP